MKENILVKLVFCLGIGLMGLIFFRFKKTTINDVRFMAEAAYTCNGNCATDCNYGSGSGTCQPGTVCCAPNPGTCASSGYPYQCTGACTAGYHCIPKDEYSCGCVVNPTAAPTLGGATATPTGGACEGHSDGDNICNNGSSYCWNICWNDGTNMATVRCATNSGCYPTYCNTSAVDVGPIYCPQSGGSPTPSGPCHPIECSNAPNSWCPNFTSASCNNPLRGDGVASCDNCGGPDCNSCGGVKPTAVPTSPGPTSINPTTVPPTPTDVPCDCLSAANQIKAGTVCIPLTFSCGAGSNIQCYGTKGCNVPSLTDLIVENHNGTVAPADAQGRNQNWENVFTSSGTTRRIRFVADVSDLDGAGNIDGSKVLLQWNGNTYPLAVGSTLGTSAVYSTTVEFADALDSGSTYPLLVSVTDKDGYSSGWVDSGRALKIWDGQVPLAGVMYDSSINGGVADCVSGSGFTNKAQASMNFKSVDIRSGGTDVVVAAHEGQVYYGVKLDWGNDYIINPNADLAANGVTDRWSDFGDGVETYSACGSENTMDQNVVDAYSLAPSLIVDMAASANQSPWFQAAGGGITARSGKITSMTPISCVAPCQAAMSIASANGSNGLVAAPVMENDAGCAFGGGICNYGAPNNWAYANNVVNEVYGYHYFYNNYYAKTGAGVMLNRGTSMTEIVSNAAIGGTGVVLVNGDVVIDTNNTVTAGKFLMVVASGKITILPTVTQTEGILVADGGITATGTNAAQLKINGSVYAAGGDISFGRGYIIQANNNISPGVLVTFRPDFMFNLPPSLSKVLTSWSQGK